MIIGESSWGKSFDHCRESESYNTFGKQKMGSWIRTSEQDSDAVCCVFFLLCS